jgi:dihydrofolate reductase
VSLDGFIAGPNGEADWIVMDPAIDFGALFREFDTLVMGRKTYEVIATQGGHGAMPGVELVVFSRSLPPATYKGVRIVSDDPTKVVEELKAQKGRDIWLFGGGVLFRTLLDAGRSTPWAAIMPVPWIEFHCFHRATTSRPGPSASGQRTCWRTRCPGQKRQARIRFIKKPARAKKRAIHRNRPVRDMPASVLRSR